MRLPAPILKFALPLLILFAAGIVFALLWAARPEVEAKALAEKVWTVEAVTVKIGTHRPRMRLEGEVVAGREGELRPLVAGRIVELHPAFHEGGRVRAGETVLRIDPFSYQAAVVERRAELAEARGKVQELEAELASARKNLARDEEQLVLARQDLDRSEKLRKAGTISDRALETARIIASEREQRVLTRLQAIARFEARLEQNRATVARLASAVERAERNLAETALAAPFDGLLVETNAAIGQLAGINDRLARLVDATALEARFHVPDALYGGLLGVPLSDLPAKGEWRVGGALRTFSAEPDRVDGQIKSASGGVLIYARLPESAVEDGLRPGAFVTVEVTGPARQGIARLPLRSVFHGSTVYVLSAGRLAARNVEAVAREGDAVLVRGDLRPGERVVATRFPEIAPGVRVGMP